jgi:hypothetical protein
MGTFFDFMDMVVDNWEVITLLITNVGALFVDPTRFRRK